MRQIASVSIQSCTQSPQALKLAVGDAQSVSQRGMGGTQVSLKNTSVSLNSSPVSLTVSIYVGGCSCLARLAGSHIVYTPAVCRQEMLWSTGILLPQDFCGKAMEAAAGQPIKKFKYFRILQSVSWQPTADQRA